MGRTCTAYTRRKPVISTFVYRLDIIDQLHRRVFKPYPHFCYDFQNLWPSKGYPRLMLRLLYNSPFALYDIAKMDDFSTDMDTF